MDPAARLVLVDPGVLAALPPSRLPRLFQEDRQVPGDRRDPAHLAPLSGLETPGGTEC